MGGKTLKVDKIIPEGGTLEIAGVVNGVGIEYQTQWTHSSPVFNNIGYVSGNVGIRTDNPDATLHVDGNVYVSSNLEIGKANLYVDTETSSVGIGTKTPQATLHVEGNVYASSNIGIGTSTPQYSLDVHGTANVGVLTANTISGDGYLLSNISASAVVGGVGVWTANDDDTIFYQTSNVGIGKTDPTTELDVEGIVTATEFVGPLTGRASIATNADNADNVYVNVQTTQSETRRIIFGPDESSDGNRALFSHDNLNYVASTGILTAEEFSGIGARLTGLVQANMPELVADSVKIGSGAGGTGQGSPAIAIGKDAGTTNQHNNSIILNASGAALNSGGTSRFYVKPVRGGNIAGSALAYTTDGEIVEETNVHFDGSGNIGIGVSTPNTTLHVEGNVYASSNLEVSNINFTGSFNQNGTPFEPSPWTTTGNDLSYTTGRVGIGTPSPNTTLHVEGDVYVSSNLEIDETTISTTTEPPVLSWATSIGTTGTDTGYGIATDSGGNVYVTGYNYTTNIGFDAFVAKYDTTGAPLWDTSIAGTTNVVGNEIATDSSGNVYVTGYFENNITIGSTTLIKTGVDYDAFVAKYDTTGTPLWATSIVGTTNAEGYGIATDSSGNVYVFGTYKGNMTIGSTTLTNAGDRDAFIAKYDTSGTVQWATSIGGTDSELGLGMAADSSGNVYVTGSYISDMTIGSTTLTNVGSNDAFVAKYDTTGTPLWATTISNTGSDLGRDIATDSSGNVYVTGRYEGNITIGSTTLTSAGSSDVFVTKYTTTGTPLWATSIGGINFDFGLGITTDSRGNVYVTGYYDGANITIGSTTLTNAGDIDAFIAKYTTTGTPLWATSIGGTGKDRGNDIVTDSSGNVYVTGYYAGNITIGSTTLTNAGGRDAFIAKYDTTSSTTLHINTGVDVQGDLNVSGTTTNVSDKRLKSNVHVIENALEKVGKLSGYTFTMNNKQNAGVIAQEVLEVLPEVVGGSEETTYSVAYGNMASLFIEAIKELKYKIEVLKTKD